MHVAAGLRAGCPGGVQTAELQMKPISVARELAGYVSLFPRRLLRSALRTRTNAAKWKRELEAQASWRDAYQRARFSQDYTADRGYLWWAAFQPDRDRIRDYLELGSWEGQSAVFAAWMFPNARLTAVDWFSNPHASARFDANVEPFAERVEKLPGTTWDILNRLGKEGRRFDVIYVDADHRFDTVLLDTVLSWPLLRPGGHLIWDDYFWSAPNWPSNQNPKPAVDSWLASRADAVRVVFAGEQVCVQKLRDDPTLEDMSGRPTWTGVAEAATATETAA